MPLFRQVSGQSPADVRKHRVTSVSFVCIYYVKAMGTILKLVFGGSVGTVHDITGAMVIGNNLIVFLHMVNKYYKTKTL